LNDEGYKDLLLLFTVPQTFQASHLKIAFVETVPTPLLASESRHLEVYEIIEGI
jgi:hypothetical protein